MSQLKLHLAKDKSLILQSDKPPMIETSIVKQNSILATEEEIVSYADRIDEQIAHLDTRLDLVLEKHERDFLSAYRLHMVQV